MFLVKFNDATWSHRSRDVALARLTALLTLHPEAIVNETDPAVYAPLGPSRNRGYDVLFEVDITHISE
jgi:hypothetical protein